MSHKARWATGLALALSCWVIWPAVRLMAQQPTAAISSDSRRDPGAASATATVKLDLRGSALRDAVRESIRTASSSLRGQSTTSTAGSGLWKWFRWVLLGAAIYTAGFFYLVSKT